MRLGTRGVGEGRPHRPGGRRRPGSPLRIILGFASLGVALVSVGALWPVSAAAQSQPLAVDRQAYVSDTGPDAYQAESSTEGTTGADPVDIHVAAIPQTTTYHSFVHVEIEALPATANIDSLVVTLFPTTNPNRASVETVNAGQAILDAFPLTSELKGNFDPNNPPKYDLKGPEVVGKLNDKDGSWSFDLSHMVAYWRQHGNTGAAIVPDFGATTSPWSIGFDRTLSTAVASVSTAAAATPVPAAVVATTAAPAPPSGGGSTVARAPSIAPAPVSAGGLSGAAGQLGTAPQASPAPAASAAPIASPVPAAPSRAPALAPAVVPTQPGNGVPVWLLVLGISLAAGIALLAQPVAQALATAGGPVAGLRSQLTVHPRMFAVAAGLLVWSSALSIYANTAGRSTLNPSSSSSVASTTSPGSSGGAVQPGATAQPGQPGVPGQPAAPGQPGSSGAGNGGVAQAGGAAGVTAAGGSAGIGAATGSGSQSSGSGATTVTGPNPPAADLFGPSDDSIGITDKTVQLCAHAALTFGPAFNIGASDLNVYWQMVDAAGGIWGRKVVDNTGAPGIEYQDDGYQPSRAVTAAQKCQDDKNFLLLGGIGFDQIPAVRVWAEQHHMLYIHHIALQAGSAGLRYSYTMLPTLEQVGVSFGQYYLARDKGLKVGIIYRNSSNWDAGRVTFEQTVKAAGADIVDEEPVNNNQGDYSTEIVKMQGQGAQVVLIWENALAAEQIIQQSHNQGYSPKWLLFPFNLTLTTLNSAGVDTSQMEGMVPWPAYTCNALDKPQYVAYRAEIKRFEDAYAKYDPNAKLCGDGGDLLFGTWEAWEQIGDLLYQCGPQCTRNKIAGLMLNGYHATVGANCPVDFRNGDGHHGGGPEDLYRVTQINGNNAWYNTGFCETTIR